MDWRNPPYGQLQQNRIDNLKRIRDGGDEVLKSMKAWYRDHPADFISDWGVTFDPRNAERNLPTRIPFILFPKQREWVDWVIARWRSQTPGLCEKSRDIGISWLSTSLACTLGIFHEGLAIGFGSRVVDLVDKIGTMKPLLPKARMFMENLPQEFRGGWESWRDAPYMRLVFPETGSLIMGEGGDQIGRGDRASIYFVDEAAYLERPELIEHSLSQTTNCRIDMSSVRQNTMFAKKRHEGKVDVFVFDWRDDPRKDQAWYDSLALPSDQFIERADGSRVNGKGLDPVTIAQEVDRDYAASTEGVIIPAAWVRAALDACEKLGLKPTGRKALALDVADEGLDKNAICGTTGVEIDYLEEWSGKGSDIFATAQRAVTICDERGYDGFRYDSDGLGASIRGDMRVINEARASVGVRTIRAEPWRGSSGVHRPEEIVEGMRGIGSDELQARTNKDYFSNLKAQGWYLISRRFYRTFRWVVGGIACNPDEIISINTKKVPLWAKLVQELSQPTRQFNKVGKMVVDKKPDNMPSPNFGDAVMIRFGPADAPMNITSAVIQQVMAAGMARRRRH